MIAEGAAEILVPDAAGVEHRVALRGVGDLLGAESAFSGAVMPWAVRAVGTTRALKLTEADTAALFDAFASDARRVNRVLIAELGAHAARARRAVLERAGARLGSKQTDPVSAMRDLWGLGGSSDDLTEVQVLPPRRQRSSGSLDHLARSGSRQHLDRLDVRAERGEAAAAGAHGASGDAAAASGGDDDEAPSSEDEVLRREAAGTGAAAADARWALLCEEFGNDLSARQVQQQQALSALLCELASKDRVSELAHAMRGTTLSEVPPDYDGRAALHLAAAHGHIAVSAARAAALPPHPLLDDPSARARRSVELSRRHSAPHLVPRARFSKSPKLSREKGR